MEITDELMEAGKRTYLGGKADGILEEREAVVRWLRAKAARAAGRGADEEAAALATAAAAIEFRLHRKEE